MLEMLKKAGFDVPDQEWCEANFVPMPWMLATVYDLNDLTIAQRQYRDVRDMIAATLPYDEWLEFRPAWVKPDSYQVWVNALQDIAHKLEQKFGIELLIAPPLDEQRERPQ
ncbi:MAG: hypothetical protein K2Y31_14220 [Burkholderiales bacterium]|jgi:hypothetical protein|nr:hypothetical protein [Burkholderiales bacterium]